jgi:hypothetical protein
MFGKATGQRSYEASRMEREMTFFRDLLILRPDPNASLQDYPVHLHMEVTDISGNNTDPEKWLNDSASDTSSNFRLEESKKKKEQ